MTPDLSVVIASVNGLEILLECLTALRRTASADASLEILVVDRCGDTVRTALASMLPEVLVLPVDPTTSIPEMRAIGFDHAQGSAIAVIDDHILVPPDWTMQLRGALASGASVVGGSVYNAATDRTVDWAAFFCEYSHVIAPEASRDAERLTGNNVAYSRELRESYSAIARKGHWEDEFHDTLRRDGIPLMCAPEIAVGHKMHQRMRDYISQRYWYSRARTGGASAHLTLAQRALGMARSFVLPPVLFARIIARVWRSHRHRHELVNALPLVALFVCVWAAGEGVGYAAGPGHSLAKIR